MSIKGDIAEALAANLLAKGFHPSVVRRRLSERGFRWRYEYDSRRHQGETERRMRLRRQHRVLCRCGKGSFYRGFPAQLCEDCLEAKWNAE